MNNQRNLKLLVNGLTLSRIPLSIIFCILVFKNKKQFFIYVLLFLIIVLTDYFDGKIARKYHLQSSGGAFLDVLTDFGFIISSIYILYLRMLIPFWMIIVVLVKFFEFLLTSILITKQRKQELSIFFDKFGRVFALGLYILPIIILVLDFEFPESEYRLISNFIYIVLSFFAIISTIYRIFSFYSSRFEIK